MRLAIVPLLLSLIAGMPALAQEEAAWPYPEDIPTIVPVAPALAGEGAPDITRFFKIRAIQGFALSPDGTKLAFTSDITGEPQLWLMAAAGGAPQQLTFGTGVTFFTWTPDGAGLLYAADSDGDEREGFTFITADGLRERRVLAKSDAFRVFGDFDQEGRRFAYASTARNGVDFDIHVAALSGREDRRVLKGKFGFFAQAWQPGGALLLVSEARGEDGNDLHLLDTGTGRLRTLFAPEVAAFYGAFQWLPDGSGFYLATNEGREFAGLAFYDLAKGAFSWVSTPKADVEDIALSGDGRYLAWTVNDMGYARLYLYDRERGQPLAVPDLPPGVYDIAFAKAAPVLAIKVSGPRVPGDVWLWRPGEDAARRVTFSATAGLDMARMAIPDPHVFPARDGLSLHGLLYLPANKPANAGKPPVIIKVHGGPTGEARPSFKADIQYFVARGIAVFDLNFRGSTGFGKSFARADNKRERPKAVRDIVDAIDWLATTGKVDASRVAIMGGSYGGYLTNAALSEFPDRFVAGVSFVGVSDWVQALEGASPALKASDREEYGDITNPEDRAFFQAISPINKAAAITAPIMVLHGKNDPRDPVSESDRFVAAIRAAGGTAIYLRFPDEGHGIRRLANRVHAYRRIAAFLEQRFGFAPGADPR
ncbi:MAG: S9 family peptidase [Pseudomonadota bacterium]